MLKTFRAEGFKSLIDLEPIEMAPLTVFFGPNAAGKSNLLDALLLLSRLATARTVAEAVDGPVRGLPLEIFSFREGEGLPGLLDQDKTSCRLEADLVDTRSAKVEGSRDRQYRYQVEVAMAPASGTLTIEDEYLAPLTSGGKLAGKPVIELADGKLRIRRRTKPAHPWEEEVGLNHAIISNKRFSGKEYAAIENARRILELRKEYGSFKSWLDAHHPRTKDEWVKLFKGNFKFVGGEIVNEFLMSSGYLPGAHEVGCPIFELIMEKRPAWSDR